MDQRRRVLFFVTLLCVLLHGKSESVDVLSTTPAPPQEQHRLAHAVNDFGYRLITRMRQNSSSNIVISPTGIAGVLAMTLLGSVGTTYDELADTLGFSRDILTNRNHHERFGELLQALNTNDTSSRTLYADAIFVDARTQIREAYRDYLKRVYLGDSLPVQFGDTNKTKDAINDWVRNHTNGRIEDFLKDPLPVSTQVVLLSALYFSGQWAKPFYPDYTKEMSFTTPSGEVMADLMLNAGDFKYVESANNGLHVQMIAMPYNDSTTTMYALKPFFPRRLNLTDLLDSLDYSKIEDLISQMTQEDSVIRFPKMTLATTTNLEQSLKAVGVKSIFDPREANLALMVDGNAIVNKSDEELITRVNRGQVEGADVKAIVNSLPNPGVYVDTVLHDVKLTVNEFGTEAVAATAGSLARSAALFYADSPFYMFIRNERTKLTTFSAIINDPTK